MSHVLEVVIPHVVKSQNEALFEFGDGVPDILKKLLLLLARLLGHLREVVCLPSLRLRHLGFSCVRRALVVVYRRDVGLCLVRRGEEKHDCLIQVVKQYVANTSGI